MRCSAIGWLRPITTSKGNPATTQTERLVERERERDIDFLHPRITHKLRVFFSLWHQKYKEEEENSRVDGDVL